MSASTDLSATAAPPASTANGPDCSDYPDCSGPPDCTDYDVVVVGGSLAGASTALLLRRANPELRILIVEQAERFGHKVGEATVEVSGFFLEQVLGLGDHLHRKHLPKHGLRYWFSSRSDDTLETMGEVGPMMAPHVPSFQLDRSVLDQHVLELAVQEGCKLMRPARVKQYQEAWPASEVTIVPDDPSDGPAESHTVSCRWLVDGSGRHAFLARKKRLIERLEEHPTNATWSRWRGTLDLDSPGFTDTVGGQSLPRLRAQRRLATNHFTGRGWWCWVIPLSNGKTSVGLVSDRRLFDLRERDGDAPSTARDRYERFVRSQPGLKQLLADAEMCDDCDSYSFMPYRTSKYMDAGWALVGDAASFIDPYYSPGLDHLAMSVTATVEILGQDLNQELDKVELIDKIAAHNKAFTVSYRRWFEALYQDKYQILGDGDLVTASFLVETSLYYFGVVTPILREPSAIRNPVFGAPLPQSRVAFRLARAFRRRMVRLAELRTRKGLYGHRNSDWSYYPKGFGLGWRVWPTLLKGLSVWARCEFEQIFAGSKARPTVDKEAAPDLGPNGTPDTAS